MSALAQHVMMRVRDDRVIAPTAEARHVVAKVVLEQGRHFRLLTFCAADTHLHSELACNRKDALEAARRIEGSLKRRLGFDTGFMPAHTKPIINQWHLAKAFDYILRQLKRHDITALDPYRVASNLPDLLGMRLLGQYSAANVRALLPRIGREQLLEYYDLQELEPAEGPMEVLVPAAAAAVGRMSLSGRKVEVLSARRALVEIVSGRLRTTQIAALLGVHRHTIHQLRQRPVDAALVQAIKLQVRLRIHLGERAETFTE